MRPPADGRPDGMWNVDNQIRPGGSPIPGSSGQVGASHIHMGRGRPVATFSSSFPGTIPLPKMPQSPPRSRTSHSPSVLDGVMMDDSTGSVDPDTPQLGVAPIPGSSRQIEAWCPGVRGPMDPRLVSSVQASICTAEMDPFAPRGWTPRSPSDLDPVGPDAPPTFLIPTTQAGPHVPQMHPLAFAPTYMPTLTGPRRAFPLDDANLPVQEHTQPVLTDIPPSPRHMLAHPYPSSSSSPGPLVAPQLGHVYQGSRLPVVWTGGLQTSEPNFRASTYLFLILQYLVTDEAHHCLFVADPGGE